MTNIYFQKLLKNKFRETSINIGRLGKSETPKWMPGEHFCSPIFSGFFAELNINIEAVRELKAKS